MAESSGVMTMRTASAAPGTVRIVAAVTDGSQPTVSTVLEREGFEALAVTADAASTIGACVQLDPDVCVVDVGVRGDALAACRTICEERPDIRVVVLAGSLEGRQLVEALAAGAAGYLLDTVAPDRLEAAVRAVVAGEVVVPAGSAAQAVGELRGRRVRRFLPGRSRVTVPASALRGIPV